MDGVMGIKKKLFYYLNIKKIDRPTCDFTDSYNKITMSLDFLNLTL